jgi:GntR family transcriptional regulator/MocR family aminotransferase
MTYDYLQLDARSSIPLYRQLYSSIREAVETGRLKRDDRLPSIRRLAEDLSLSCTTVESAYQQLCVEGFIRSEPQRGYFAAFGRSVPERRVLPPPGSALPKEKAVRYNLGTDCVDSENIDAKIWRRHIREVLNRQNVIASYGNHQGEPELRAALSKYSYGTRGVSASPEQIVIGAGTQPLLNILCGLLGDGEKRVAMEEPGFRQAEQVFVDCGFTVLKLPGDRDGIRMDALRGCGARIVYAMPSNRVRTGSSIPMSRRFELLEWAEQNGGVVIEDDHNGELRYRAHPIPAMQGIGGAESVVYLGSFSKLLLPSVRIGYMALTPALLERYLPRAENYNQTASKIEQLALGGYIESGQMERHLRRLRKLYGAKSERLIRALKDAFGKKAGILLQETPLCLILSLRTREPAEELCRLAREKGVRVTPAGDGGKILLGFAGIPLEDIDGAVARLKEAWGFFFPPYGISAKAVV